jgi:hypothetical protein
VRRHVDEGRCEEVEYLRSDPPTERSEEEGKIVREDGGRS